MAYKTKAELGAEIAANLASGSNITAAEHRQVADDIVDSMAQGWVKDGTNVSLQDDADNVGIGTDTPGAKFRVTAVSGDYTSELQIHTGGSDGMVLSGAQSGIGGWEISAATGSNGIKINATPAYVILQDTGGNVGIGVSAADTKLHVDGSLKFDNVPAFDDDADAGLGGLSAGRVYQTTGSGSAPLNAAGILMIKQ